MQTIEWQPFNDKIVSFLGTFLLLKKNIKKCEKYVDNAKNKC